MKQIQFMDRFKPVLATIKMGFQRLRDFIQTPKGKTVSLCSIIGTAAVLLIVGVNAYIFFMQQPTAIPVVKTGSSESSEADSSVSSSNSLVVSTSSAVSAPASTSSAAESSPASSAVNNTTGGNSGNKGSTGGATAPTNPTPTPTPTPTPAPTTGENKAGLTSYGNYSYPYGVEETNAQFRSNESAYNCDKVDSDIIAQYVGEGYTFDTNAGNVYCTGDGASCIRGKLSGQGQTHVVDVAWYYGQDGKYHHAIVVKLS